jgi:hypothetical protein
VPPAALAAAPATPLVQTAAPGPGGGWLLGGVVIDPDGTRHVAIWASDRPAGPWTQAPMTAVPGRDGPNETIFSIAGTTGRMAAFGYRRSPTEGYPRPSTWVSTPGPSAGWQEILENREFLGGPNVIGFANLVYGPHGFTLAGTWTDPQARPTLALWRSPDGTAWARDSTEPAFDGSADQIPVASGVADSPAGLLLVGTVETPEPGDPVREEGGLWFSPTGKSWSRVPVSATSEPPASSTSFDAVTAIPGGWVVVGTERTADTSRPAAWLVDSRLGVGPPVQLPGSGPGGFTPRAAATYGSQVFVIGSTGDRSETWTAEVGSAGRLGWKVVSGPVGAGFPIDTAWVAAGREGVVVVLSGADRSAEWWTTALPG